MENLGLSSDVALDRIAGSPRLGVIHQGVDFQLDEKGTTATAASLGGVLFGSDQPVSFTADHPFLFFIRQAKTGTVLFLGRVVNPQAN